MQVSVVIRTFNEARYLDELLSGVADQDYENVEIVVIDSGSTDATLSIAERHGCVVTHIEKADFTFGRSLNMGSEKASGDILVYISGHCVPKESDWLTKLTAPIRDGVAHYSYGRQVGRDGTKFSERRLFNKYFPETSRIPQDGFFCNNANAAIARRTFSIYRFDEDVTGLEDMELAKRLVRDGGRVAYVADAPVYHIHDETWVQTKRRYEREAIALQTIMPEINVSLFDAFRYGVSGVMSDLSEALMARRTLREIVPIIKFRAAQYWGTYRGNHEHRKLSRKRKENYYYPARRYGDSK